MSVVTCAFALLSGVVGAGFASGREILRFFAVHGSLCGVAVLCALASLSLFFLRLPAQMRRLGVSSLGALCRACFGPRFGRFCALLFFLLCAVTGGAMLAACAELSALLLPLRHSYGVGLAFSLLLSALLASRGLRGLALPGAALCVLLPALMIFLLLLPAGEACFLPAMTPDLPVRAVADGLCYGALNAAMLCGAAPLLLELDAPKRRRAVQLFALLFGLLLLLGATVCRRHLPAVLVKPMPFVFLSRSLGIGGYFLTACCLYVAAFSTLCAMLAALSRLLPARHALAASAALCLCFAGIGFSPLVSSAYPVLGALCAALLALLCLPLSPRKSASL